MNLKQLLCWHKYKYRTVTVKVVGRNPATLYPVLKFICKKCGKIKVDARYAEEV